jgi:hypothetical protein
MNQSQLFVTKNDEATQTAMVASLYFAAVALVTLWPAWRSLPA